MTAAPLARLQASQIKADAKESSNRTPVTEPETPFELAVAPRVPWSIANLPLDFPVQRKCSCGGSGPCAKCSENESEEETSTLQRKAHSSSALTAATGPSIVRQVLRAPGEPINNPIRHFFEMRFAQNLSDVRIHNGDMAAQSARSVNALAYTVGNHVVFGAGRYNPASRAGQALLAHELTHVLQQRSGLRSRSGLAADAGEQEALRNENAFHSAQPLTFSSPSASLARKDGDSTMQAPTGPPGCTAEQHTLILPAANLAIQWLDHSIEQLLGFLANPAAPASAAANQALQRHFHSTDPATAQRVVDRVRAIRQDIDSVRVGPQLTTECHSTEDHDCGHANAYVSGDRNLLAFCPIFFGWSLEARAESIVHEMAHSIIGDITDRAYRDDRLLPVLNAAEALTNAESFGLLVEELGRGQAPSTSPPEDTFDSTCREIQQLVQVAMARAQRWNRSGETRVMSNAPADMIQHHLGTDTPQIRQTAYDFYHGAQDGLRKAFRFVCDKDCSGRLAFGETAHDNTGLGAGIGAAIGAVVGLIGGGILGGLLGSVGAGLGLGLLAGAGLGALIGAAIGSATSPGPKIHVCPGWKDLPDESARIQAILAAAYEALGHTQADSLKYARLADAISAQFFAAPQIEQIDRDWIRRRIRIIQARLAQLKGQYNALSDSSSRSLLEERERDSLARGSRDLRRQVRSDIADAELWGGHFAGDRIRSAVSASSRGSAVTLSANIQLTYLALSDQQGRQRAAIDIPRIQESIRTAWDVNIQHGDYAGVFFRLIPSIAYLPPGATQPPNSILIQVRGPDLEPSSGDAVHGLISLAPAHLEGARVVVVAHELAHAFGFVDTYFTETRNQPGGRTSETMIVGRTDAANRPDLLGMIDPVVLERERQKGAVTPQDIARQTGPVRIWEEQASIVLRTLGVDPPAHPRPTRDSEDFDPQVELDRTRREGDAQLDRIRAQRERIDQYTTSTDLAEQIISLETEERDLNARLSAQSQPTP
jgi:hypothetical protein